MGGGNLVRSFGLVVGISMYIWICPLKRFFSARGASLGCVLSGQPRKQGGLPNYMRQPPLPPHTNRRYFFLGWGTEKVKSGLKPPLGVLGMKSVQLR